MLTNHIENLRYRNTKPIFHNQAISADDIKQINQLAQMPLKPEQVYVRSMFLCSNQPCLSDGCQFTVSALQQIAKLIVGQSVLSGHNRNTLPLARFYKAKVVEKQPDLPGGSEPVYFVQAWFYWLRETSGAKDMLLNIDGGIYREVSLAWKYNHWHCSICNAENGGCNHRVGEEYNGKRCFRLITEVYDVLEGSLVYKAADKDTHLSGMHHKRFETQSNHQVLLIANHDDPTMQHFQQNDCCQMLSNEDLDTLQESIEHLWLRNTDQASAKQTADKFLTDNGTCFSQSNQDTQNLWLCRQENNIIEQPITVEQ